MANWDRPDTGTPLNNLSIWSKAIKFAILIFCMPLTAAGCADPIGDAEKQAEIVKAQKYVTSREVCAADRAVADAYLKADNAKGYADARMFADASCLKADMDRYGGDSAYRDEERIEADNLDIPED